MERQGLLMVRALALLLNGVRVPLFTFLLSTSASDHTPHCRPITRQSNETLKPETPIGPSKSVRRFSWVWSPMAVGGWRSGTVSLRDTGEVMEG